MEGESGKQVEIKLESLTSSG